MNIDHDKLVKEIFADALEKANAAERATYLAQACGNDVQLRQRVEALLRAHEKAGGFLEEPAAALPGKTIVVSTPPTEKPGDHIGHYKLLQQIGEGGCGVVYMAEQEQPIRRRVALKVIKLGMDTKAVIARFEAERQALALMDHPNIAKVLDAGATDTGRPYFVMELVRGIKITDYCDQNNLSTEERLDLFVQICHAIQHAHQKGIIHRDIKPSNILVTVHDGKPLPKIIDFGIAKATSGQLLTDKTLFTAFEQFIGTPAYMSPEQAEMSTLDIDTRSDIYALGVLLYELLTGRTPFDQEELVAAGLSEMRRIIREQEPMRPSTRISTLEAADQTTVAKRRHSEPPQLIHVVRGDLDWIVMKCLEKDRTRRYDTANGLADDVQRHLQDEPITARPPGRVYRLQKLVRRNKLVFGAASAVVAALVIGLGLSTWLFWQEREARQQAVAAEQKAKAEAAKSQQVAQFLKDMLSGVGPSVARGRDTTMLREILDKTAERVGRGLKDQPEVEAELKSTIGDVYAALGQYGNAEEMYRSALALRQAPWGNMNTNVADSLDNLGRVLLNQDKWVEAEPPILEALIIRTNLLGSEHIKVAASLYHLSQVRYFQARSEEAEQLYQRSSAMRKKLLGNEKEDVAETLSGLSGATLQLFAPDQVEANAREELAMRASLLPEAERAATDAGMTQTSSAWAPLSPQGKLADRETVMRRQLVLGRKLLGPEHPRIVKDLTQLAYVLADEGKLDEAEATVREGLALSRKTLGPQHSWTAWCLHELGWTLKKEGRFAEAEAPYREALLIERSLEGSLARSGIYTTIGDLADVYRAQGKLDEAEPLYREALDFSLRVATNDFTLRVWFARGLADVLKNRGKLAEAESLYRETLEVMRKLPPSIDLVVLLASYADMLRDEGKLTEAEPLYREGLDLCRRITPNDFELRQWLTVGLTAILRDQGKQAEAESLYRETLEIGKKLPPSPDLAPALAALADFLRDQGKLAEAESLYREGLELCRQLDPNNFEPRQWLAAGVALVLKTQGKLAEAEPFYREAVTNSAKVWPNDFDRWQWQFNDLVDVLQRQGKTNEVESLRREAAASGWNWQPSSLSMSALAAQGDKLRDQGKFTEAEPVYREGLEICRQLATNNPETHQWLASGMAYVLQRQRRWAEAEPFYREAITNSATVWPNEPARWRWQVAYLAFVLRSQGKLAEAEPFYREVVSNAAKFWPNNFKRWEWQFNELVDVLQRQDKLNEVQQLRNEFLPATLQNQPPETISTNKAGSADIPPNPEDL